MAREITDLHGNKFRTEDFKLCLDLLPGKGILIFTRDLISGEAFNLYVHKQKYYGYFYSESLGLYIRYNLILLGYEEKSDIRKSHLYVKRKKK